MADSAYEHQVSTADMVMRDKSKWRILWACAGADWSRDSAGRQGPGFALHSWRPSAAVRVAHPSPESTLKQVCMLESASLVHASRAEEKTAQRSSIDHPYV